MNRLAVAQGYHTESPPAELGDDAPVSNPAVRLGFPLQRIRDDSFAPLALDVRSLAQDLLFKVARAFHGGRDYRRKVLAKAKRDRGRSTGRVSGGEQKSGSRKSGVASSGD